MSCLIELCAAGSINQPRNHRQYLSCVYTLKPGPQVIRAQVAQRRREEREKGDSVDPSPISDDPAREASGIPRLSSSERTRACNTRINVRTDAAWWADHKPIQSVARCQTSEASAGCQLIDRPAYACNKPLLLSSHLLLLLPLHFVLARFSLFIPYA